MEMNVDSEPLVSVLMAAYNAADTIGASIDSVLRQYYQNWELIIVNDGSTDDTEQRVRTFADDRIFYYEIEHSGVSMARNKALTVMHGEFLCFLDADDVLTSHSISSRVALFRENEALGIVDGQVLVTREALEDVIRIYTPVLSGRIVRAFALLSEAVFCMPSAMIRREQGVEYRFDPAMTHAEDIWFFLSVHSQSRLLFGSVQTPILYYRRLPDTAMIDLDGLGRGYQRFYDHVCEESLLRGRDLLRLRYRISRIMFLSYLRKGALLKAVSRLWWLISA